MHALKRRLFRLMNSVQKWDIWPIAIRIRLLRLGGVTIGPNCNIMADCDFVYGKITMGSGVFFNRGCLIEGIGGIEIADNAFFAHRVVIITTTHKIGSSDQRANVPRQELPVKVGAGSWIGAGSLILPGVTVAAGAIVAAGAVVAQDVPADSLAAGVPTKVKKSLAA